MRRQYIVLLAVFAALIVLSLWAASYTSLPEIESRLTSVDRGDRGAEGFVEGGLLLPYLVVVGVLVAIGIAMYLIYGKKHTED
jgi:Ca2+/Na+ antiporter